MFLGRDAPAHGGLLKRHMLDPEVEGHEDIHGVNGCRRRLHMHAVPVLPWAVGIVGADRPELWCQLLAAL